MLPFDMRPMGSASVTTAGIRAGVSQEVFILDNDLGFLMWLAEILAASGFEPIPAHNVEEAERMAHALRRPIDLLIVNPKLPGARKFSEKLKTDHQGLLTLLLLPDRGDLDATIPGVRAFRRKPSIADDRAKSEWVSAIREMLSGCNQ